MLILTILLIIAVYRIIILSKRIDDLNDKLEIYRKQVCFLDNIATKNKTTNK